MVKVPDNWPAGVLPRLMDEDTAAFYCGTSAGTFRNQVKKGRYPQPQRDGRRVLYDRHALDRAIDLGSGLQSQANYTEDTAAEDAAMNAITPRRTRRQ